jgi:hypothetical protein
MVLGVKIFYLSGIDTSNFLSSLKLINYEGMHKWAENDDYTKKNRSLPNLSSRQSRTVLIWHFYRAFNFLSNQIL